MAAAEAAAEGTAASCSRMPRPTAVGRRPISRCRWGRLAAAAPHGTAGRGAEGPCRQPLAGLDDVRLAQALPVGRSDTSGRSRLLWAPIAPGPCWAELCMAAEAPALDHLAVVTLTAVRLTVVRLVVRSSTPWHTTGASRVRFIPWRPDETEDPLPHDVRPGRGRHRIRCPFPRLREWAG